MTTAAAFMDAAEAIVQHMMNHQGMTTDYAQAAVAHSIQAALTKGDEPAALLVELTTNDGIGFAAMLASGWESDRHRFPELADPLFGAEEAIRRLTSRPGAAAWFDALSARA